jgi:hypothetical protein
LQIGDFDGLLIYCIRGDKKELEYSFACGEYKYGSDCKIKFGSLGGELNKCLLISIS